VKLIKHMSSSVSRGSSIGIALDDRGSRVRIPSGG